MSPPALQPGGPPVFGRASAAADRPPLLRRRSGMVPAWRADGGDAPPWSVRVASVVGVRHRLAGTPSEDTYGWSVRGGVLTVAVADGVGSVDDSALAAAAAVGALSAAPDDLDCVGVVDLANDLAGAAGGSTTLVVAAVGSDGRCRLARVGDSTAMVLDDGVWREVFDVDGGDDGLLDTATAALPSADPVAETAEVDLRPGAALVLVTDGVAGPIRDGPTTVAPAFAASLAAPPAPLALAGLLDFSRQGCHDDRTLLAVWWTPDDPGAEEAPADRADGAATGLGDTGV